MSNHHPTKFCGEGTLYDTQDTFIIYLEDIGSNPQQKRNAALEYFPDLWVTATSRRFS